MSDPSLEEEESGPSDGDDTFPLEHMERPGTEDDAVPGLSSIEGGGQPGREPPAFTNAGENRLQMGRDNERQEFLSDEE